MLQINQHFEQQQCNIHQGQVKGASDVCMKAMPGLTQSWGCGAGHLFYRVGLAPCNLATASAPLGATVTIPFAVYDEGSPQLKSTVNRTLLVVSPCSAGNTHTCMPM